MHRSRSMVDSLTCIPNRRYFEEVIKKEWGRSKREKKHLSLIMLDIDYFKEFNDNYGHQAGDDTLRKVSEALSGTANRQADVVARYVGEEFAVVLPQTDSKGAVKIADKMCRRVEDLQISHEYSPAADMLTISAGVATIQPQAVDRNLSFDVLIKNADEALFEAKRQGKRRVACRLIDINSQKEQEELRH